MSKRIVIGVLLLIIAGGIFMLFRKPKEIKTSGPYSVNQEDYWITEDMLDPLLKNGSNRQIQIRRFYPDGPDALENVNPKPVVIASHGSCGPIENNGTLYKELVSHGYEVLAVGHTGHAASVTLENGKKVGPSKEFIMEMGAPSPNADTEKTYSIFKKWMELRLTDLNYVMDDYKKKNGDSKKFIALGHSLGGSAAYGIARTRPEVVACIALESPFLFDIKGVEADDFVFDESDYTVPVLNIYSDSSWKYLREWKQYKNNARFLDSENPIYTNIHYEGTGHMGLCDLSYALPWLAKIIDKKNYKIKPEEQLKKINKDCMDFLSKLDFIN